MSDPPFGNISSPNRFGSQEDTCVEREEFMRSPDSRVVVRVTFPLKAWASLVPVATSLLRCGGRAIKDMQHALAEVFANAECLRLSFGRGRRPAR